ncbi:uncharacterized protein LOC135394271 [Ornithodoros turicata]|uniref:uncharacterized protein LOC135394271 n=1 Tax=Ornithodoros turicata TaxID=34597 RepID=UPI0031392675
MSLVSSAVTSLAEMVLEALPVTDTAEMVFVAPPVTDPAEEMFVALPVTDPAEEMFVAHPVMALPVMALAGVMLGTSDRNKVFSCADRQRSQRRRAKEDTEFTMKALRIMKNKVKLKCRICLLHRKGAKYEGNVVLIGA